MALATARIMSMSKPSIWLLSGLRKPKWYVLWSTPAIR